MIQSNEVIMLSNNNKIFIITNEASLQDALEEYPVLKMQFNDILKCLENFTELFQSGSCSLDWKTEQDKRSKDLAAFLVIKGKLKKLLEDKVKTGNIENQSTSHIAVGADEIKSETIDTQSMQSLLEDLIKLEDLTQMEQEARDNEYIKLSTTTSWYSNAQPSVTLTIKADFITILQNLESLPKFCETIAKAKEEINKKKKEINLALTKNKEKIEKYRTQLDTDKVRLLQLNTPFGTQEKLANQIAFLANAIEIKCQAADDKLNECGDSAKSTNYANEEQLRALETKLGFLTIYLDTQQFSLEESMINQFIEKAKQDWEELETVLLNVIAESKTINELNSKFLTIENKMNNLKSTYGDCPKAVELVQQLENEKAKHLKPITEKIEQLKADIASLKELEEQSFQSNIAHERTDVIDSINFTTYIGEIQSKILKLIEQKTQSLKDLEKLSPDEVKTTESAELQSSIATITWEDLQNKIKNYVNEAEAEQTKVFKDFIELANSIKILVASFSTAISGGEQEIKKAVENMKEIWKEIYSAFEKDIVRLQIKYGTALEAFMANQEIPKLKGDVELTFQHALTSAEGLKKEEVKQEEVKEELKEENLDSKIIVHSFDVDGCLFSHLYYQHLGKLAVAKNLPETPLISLNEDGELSADQLESIKEFVEQNYTNETIIKLRLNAFKEAHSELLKDLVSKMAKEKNVTLMIGSNRQSHGLDVINVRQRMIDGFALPSSCFPMFSILQQLLQAELSFCNVTIDGFLLADLNDELSNPGDHYKAALQKEKDDPGEYYNLDPKYAWDQCIYDSSKFILLYAQIHYLASKAENRNKKIVYQFWDDMEDIRENLQGFFSANPDLLPDNVTLWVKPYYNDKEEKNGATIYTPKWSKLDETIPIIGTGKVDFNYRANVKALADHPKFITVKDGQTLKNSLGVFEDQKELALFKKRQNAEVEQPQNISEIERQEVKIKESAGSQMSTCFKMANATKNGALGLAIVLAGVGAALGGGLGSMVPIIGTTIGAIIGAILFGIIGFGIGYSIANSIFKEKNKANNSSENNNNEAPTTTPCLTM